MFILFIPFIPFIPLLFNKFHRYEQCGNCIHYKEDPDDYDLGECTCEDSCEFEEIVGYDDESCFDYEEKDDIDEY